MTWWLWLVVIALCAAMFGIGVYASLVFWPRKPADLDRVHAAMGVVFVIVALIVVVDIVYLQADYQRFAIRARLADEQQIACNRKTLGALTSISHERRMVDDQAREFDFALLAFLAEGTPATKEALVSAAKDVADARASMVKVYDSVVLQAC